MVNYESKQTNNKRTKKNKKNKNDKQKDKTKQILDTNQAN